MSARRPRSAGRAGAAADGAVAVSGPMPGIACSLRRAGVRRATPRCARRTPSRGRPAARSSPCASKRNLFLRVAGIDGGRTARRVRKMRTRGRHIGLAGVAPFAAGMLLAHGGLDSCGGHTDRRTGEYHKHRVLTRPRMRLPARTVRNDRLQRQTRCAPHAATRLDRAVHLPSGRLRQGRGHRAHRRVVRSVAQRAVVRQSAGVHERPAEHHRRMPACEPAPIISN